MCRLSRVSYGHGKGYTLENERVNIALPAKERQLLGELAEQRGMTLRAFIMRVVRWMATLDPSEQAIVLDQVSRGESGSIAALVLARRFGEVDAILAQLDGAKAALQAAASGAQSPKPKTAGPRGPVRGSPDRP